MSGMKPFRIQISRELHVPPVSDDAKRKQLLDIIADGANDWTHFTHVHSKTIIRYELLYKQGSREIFLYQGRRIYPLPWFDHFIVFRDYQPEQNGYRNVYYHVKSGTMNFLDSYTREKPDGGIELVGKFVFTMPFYWRFFPKLFLYVFNKRMRKLIDEDNVIINERMRMQGFETPGCKPTIPERYDLFEAMFSGEMPKADVSYSDKQIYPGLENT